MKKIFISCCCCVFIILLKCIDGFNVDIQHPIIKSGENVIRGSIDSYFGYTVALLGNSGGIFLLVGAPRANSSYHGATQPGAIYSCAVTSNQQCQEIDFRIRQPDKPIVTSSNYFELLDNSWLGVSLDVSKNDQSDVLTCGHLWKDKQYNDLYPSNGICYTINSDLNVNSVQKMLPLVHKKKQLMDTIYFYALGMAGFSGQFQADGNGILLGAPGVYDFMGTVVASLKQDQPPKQAGAQSQIHYRIPYPDTNRRPMDSYLGYAVTSGKYYKNTDISYAAGAPREGNGGKVYIFQFLSDPNDPISIKMILPSDQMASYFGSSLHSADVNGDGLHDLLVGAPFQTLNEEHGDEGAVFLYISDGNTFPQTPVILTGSTTYGARFGTTIASVGDLNKDGFTDIAIGAPYEDGRGAVYIYHGSSKGIVNKLSQKIRASDLNLNLNGFGISISNGKDVDGNGYPDFSVGAYTSSEAVILRTQPIVKVYGSITFDTKSIKTDNKQCIFNGEKHSCFKLGACVQYTAGDVSNDLDLDIVLESDVLKKTEKRVFFSNGTDVSYQLNYTLHAVKNNEACRMLTVFVRENVVDFLTPVYFRESYVVRKMIRSLDFCKHCPVIDPTASSYIEKEIPFSTNCGEDDICQSDLQIDVSAQNVNILEGLIIGSRQNLIFNVNVKNVGDPAYQSMLHVAFPSVVNIVRVPTECTLKSEEKTLQCRLGNPIENEEVKRMMLEFDLAQITNSMRNLEFNFSVKTASQESDNKMLNNIVNMNLPLIPVADINVVGYSRPEEVLYNISNSGSHYVSHIFEIFNTRPTPIESVALDVWVPVATKNSTSFLLNFSVRTTYEGREVLCAPSPSVIPTETIEKEFEDSPYGKMTVVGCGSMLCSHYNCQLGPFHFGQSAKINITTDLDIESLIKLTEAELLAYASSATVQINDDIPEFHQTNEKPDSAKISTLILPLNQPLEPRKLQIWIILVAILVGILLLLLAVFMLYKLGFFKRKQKEEMEKMMYTATATNGGGGGDNALLNNESFDSDAHNA